MNAYFKRISLNLSTFSFKLLGSADDVDGTTQNRSGALLLWYILLGLRVSPVESGDFRVQRLF